MGLKERIFDLVFPERRRLRKPGRRVSGSAGGRKKRPPRETGDGTDARYFIRRRR